MNKFYIFTVLILASLSLLAQQATLQTFDEVAPHDLAALIMGEQAVVSNARVEGDDGAGGLFMGATDLGFENGVILTTGSAEVALSHNHIGSSTLNTGTAGDPDLENFPWSYSGTYNACILEFDFVPTGNQISFDYIFGSDEYPEWVGSQFNDAFAIFIEGGSEYPSDTPIEERNIAIIPGTSDVYVAINFLNAGSYNEFYIDNTTAEREIQYDGFTLPLPATASVTPGLTYHLKFSIADVSDASYDSGIFIALEGEDVLVYKTLNLLAFWDQNGNNSQDENETALYNQSFLAEPSNKLITTNSEGESSVALLEGNHQLSFKETTLWEMVVPTTYDISIDENTELPTYFFGLQPKRIIYDVVPHLNSSPTRCNTEVTYYLDYNNSGTTIGNGKVSLEFDELMEFVEAVPQPDGIQDGKLIWNFANLYPSHQNKIQIRFNIPDENFIGEILETQATVETYFEDQVIAKTESTSYYSEVRCSYDPNDKLVRSNLLGQSEFAYLADTVFYTVRFQNTGNDVAFNVRVEDVLDKKLDWTTFHPITASHDFYTTFDRTTGKATFFFDNIMLPDNKTNEAESHGFVMFGIVSLSNIGDKLEVDNTASIFFDENPPIVTNTAILTLVEQVETDIEVINTNYSIRIFPNPFSDYTTIEVGGLPQGSYRLEVMDILGRKVRELTMDGEELILQRGDLESGLYLIQVLEENRNDRVLGSGKVLVE